MWLVALHQVHGGVKLVEAERWSEAKGIAAAWEREMRVNHPFHVLLVDFYCVKYKQSKVLPRRNPA